MLNWKFYLLIILFLFILSTVWGSSYQITAYNERDVINIGLALRQKFYPHLDEHELRMFLLWDENPANQSMIYQRHRLPSAHIDDIKHIKDLSIRLAGHFQIDGLGPIEREEALWVLSNFRAIMCDRSLIKAFDVSF